MSIRLIVLMSIVVMVVMALPEPLFGGDCSVALCYKNTGCPHTPAAFNNVDPHWYKLAEQSTRSMVGALKGMGEYDWANLLVYFGLVPMIAGVSAWLHQTAKWWYVGMVVTVLTLLGVGELTFSGGWFWYCTDFCMRVANVTGLTYGGICFFLFVVAIPGVLLLDFVMGLIRWYLRETPSDTAVP